jgi:hypothetical protein
MKPNHFNPLTDNWGCAMAARPKQQKDEGSTTSRQMNGGEEIHDESEDTSA